MYPLPSLVHSLLHCEHPHQRGTFVTTDEPTLACHHHSEAMVYLAVTRDGVHSMGLDKWIVTRAHHDTVTQSNFTARKDFVFFLIVVCASNI